MTKIAVMLLMLLAIPVRPDRLPPPSAPPTVLPLLDQLQGEWRMTVGIIGGRNEPADKVASSKLVVKGKSLFLTERNRDKPEEARITLDPTRMPATIDIMPNGEANQDIRVEGILKIEGDKMTMCFTHGGGPGRPRSFASPVDSGVVLLEFQRVPR